MWAQLWSHLVFYERYAIDFKGFLFFMAEVFESHRLRHLYTTKPLIFRALSFLAFGNFAPPTLDHSHLFVSLRNLAQAAIESNSKFAHGLKRINLQLSSMRAERTLALAHVASPPALSRKARRAPALHATRCRKCQLVLFAMPPDRHRRYRMRLLHSHDQTGFSRQD